MSVGLVVSCVGRAGTVSEGDELEIYPLVWSFRLLAGVFFGGWISWLGCYGWFVVLRVFGWLACWLVG